MIQLDDALRRLLAAAAPLPVERVVVWEAVDRVAARDVRVPEAVPPVPRAAMDGYVCHAADVADASPSNPVRLRVTGRARIGLPPGAGPGRGEAWEITTGTPLPNRGDRVLPFETVRRRGSWLVIERVPRKPHVFEPGEELRVGALLIRAGERLRPPALSALAAAGVTEVAVYRRPAVALFATGDELQEAAPGARLPAGRAFNSNAVMLSADLRAAGCAVSYRGIVRDDPRALREAFAAAVEEGFDVVLSTGGVSVGAQDRVPRTWLELGARRVVGRIDLRPGGPFFAGLLGTTWAVGLSGNPPAALAAYHLLVRPLLARLAGLSRPVRPVEPVRLSQALPGGAERTRALWAHVPERSWREPVARILVPHDGGTLAGMAAANALVLLRQGTPPLPAGAMAPALRLDRPECRDDLIADGLPYVLGVVGASGSGKTRVIEGLIRRLVARGLRVAAVKHAAHGFAVDRADSDSGRMFAAGSDMVVLAGPAETAVRLRSPAPDTAEDAVALAVAVACHRSGGAPDVILVEGFAHPHRPVVLVEPTKPDLPHGPVLAHVPRADLSEGNAALESLLDELAASLAERLARTRSEP